MNFYFLLSAIFNIVFCSLPYTMTIEGLYESMVGLPEHISNDIISSCELTRIGSCFEFSRMNNMRASYCEVVADKKQVYGIFDYEMLRGQFYDGRFRNHQSIEVLYICKLFNISLSSLYMCYNIRFLSLTNDNNNTLELKSHFKDYYMNTVGGTIKNLYERTLIKVGKEYILDLKLKERDFPLFYYKSHGECLSELKSILDKSADIICCNNVFSAIQFLNLYSSKIQKESLSVETYVEATKMINKMYSMIRHHECELLTASTPSNAQDPVVENDVVKVYKSVCLGFDCSIYRKKVDIKIIGFDSNNQVISGDKFMSKQVNRFILIPFKI